MTYIRSFTYIERELMHQYRDQLNHAESEEDVKKFFTQTVQRLLDSVLENPVVINERDISLSTGDPPYFEISGELAENRDLQSLQQHSDLSAVLRRFAEPAVKHYQHLRGRPEKTESKIRHHS